jgi:polyisoprenoid-binding protein YceI
MTSRFLQAFGAVALAALVLGSVAALSVVKGRLNITVAEADETPTRGPDPLELLRADVAELRTEVGTLGSALPEHLQVLHQALSDAADTRAQNAAAEVAELRRQVSALQARLDTTSAELGAQRTQNHETLTRLASAVNDLFTGVQALASQASALAAAAPVIDLKPIEVVAVETPVIASETPAQPTAPEPAAAAAEPAKKGFLSFKVPEKGFRFEGRQKLGVVASLSRVGFDAKSTLHDFSGVTQKVEGELVVDLAQPGLSPSGKLEVDASSLDTGLADRDEGMRELLKTKEHSKLVFEWTGFEPDKVDVAAQKVTGKARGNLTLRGKSREVTMPVTVTVDASKRVGIEGELTILLTDFGIEPPSQLGMISVEDKLKLWISLRARTLGPVEVTK